MLVEFEGRFSKEKEDLITKVIGFGSSILFPNEDNVFINIQAIRKQGVCGDCMYEDDGDFTIRLNNTLPASDLISTILHELVHVSQFLKGLVMDDESKYEERWQEVEAHAKELQLRELWDGQNGN